MAVFEAAVGNVFLRAAKQSCPFAFEIGGIQAGFLHITPQMFALSAGGKAKLLGNMKIAQLLFDGGGGFAHDVLLTRWIKKAVSHGESRLGLGMACLCLGQAGEDSVKRHHFGTFAAAVFVFDFAVCQCFV